MKKTLSFLLALILVFSAIPLTCTSDITSAGFGIISEAASLPSKATLSAVSNSKSGVKVTWKKAKNAKSYLVYRKTSSTSWKYLGSSTSLSYIDKTAKSGTTYKYTVKSKNSAGKGSYDKTGLTIKRLATTSITSKKSTKSGISLKWEKVTGAKGYYIYRKTGSGSWSKIKTVSDGAKVSFVDKNVKQGKTYYYRIKVFNGSYKSAYSSSVSYKYNYTSSTSGSGALTSTSTVYITPTGTKFHISSSCAGANAIKTTYGKASEKGYDPCKKCAANVSVSQKTSNNETEVSERSASFSGKSIPAYSNSPYVSVNGNKPYFEKSEYKSESYEYYSPLDSLGRCGYCKACIGKDLMPTEERGEIGSVKPTGWHTVKYDCVDGKYLYNRCHLIGYQLTAENANQKNLITGTRYLNIKGMLPFENMVADYITETGNHVLYRVTPVFEGENLLAKGVLMEAYSVEDNGNGICFCVFCYNVQPGISINYKTGDSSLLK